MDPEEVIRLLMHGNQLKRTPRTGWVQRGVVAAENVAAHSYGTVFTAMVLCELIAGKFNLGRVLALATLHDLPESKTSDIPRPAWRFLPEGSKQTAEAGAMSVILGDAPFFGRWTKWWEELVRNESREARLVHDADKLDLFLQALAYQRQTGNETLSEFWTTPHTFHFAEAQAIYDELRRRAGFD